MAAKSSFLGLRYKVSYASNLAYTLGVYEKTVSTWSMHFEEV